MAADFSYPDDCAAKTFRRAPITIVSQLRQFDQYLLRARRTRASRPGVCFAKCSACAASKAPGFSAHSPRDFAISESQP